MDQYTGELPLDPDLDLSRLSDDQRVDLEAALLGSEALPVPRADVVEEEQERAARASYVTHGGNVAAVSRDTGLAPAVIHRLADRNDWPLYGDGASQTEKATRTRLTRLHGELESKLFNLLDSLDVETKQKDDLIEKGMASRYVAPLSQRSGAFKQVFDAYTKVGQMVAPEVFDVGALDVSGSRQAKGGLAGANRSLEAFIANVAVGIADQINRRDRGAAALEAAHALPTAPGEDEYVIEAEHG